VSFSIYSHITLDKNGRPVPFLRRLQRRCESRSLPLAICDQLTTYSSGQTEVVEANGTADNDDFLARERAALGEDADQFATPNDLTATAEDEDDLIGGNDAAPQVGSQELSGFESSFPALDTGNEVMRLAYYQTNYPES
jgi:hypothetical protein